MSPANSRRLSHLAIAGALLGALMLGACGKQGDLDKPAPLFGAKAKANYQAEKNRQAAIAKAAKAGSSDAAPPARDYGQGDPSLDSLRASPPPGASPTPFDRTAPGGVLPDPVANPNGLPQ